MSRTKRRIANLDPAESYKPQLVTTQWLDNDGVVRTTVHDGNFSPPPQEPTLVFVPAQFCDEFYTMRIMEDRKENPQQVENGSYKYLRTAFLSPNSQQSETGKSTIDGNEQNASVVGRISVKTSTTSDFSDSFKEFLEPYMDNYEIIFTDAQIEDWLESGTHTLKVEYNGEESETMTFTVASADYMYFEAAEANSTVGMMSSLETAPNLEYSTDGETWHEWQHTTADGTHTFDTLTLSSVGDRVYLRGDNQNGLGAMPEGSEGPLYSHFEMTGKIASGGNIMSLLDTTMEMTEIPDFGYTSLFGDSLGDNPNTSLISAPSMATVTKIGICGCTYTFSGCTSLESDIDLSSLLTVEYLGCSGMFGETKIESINMRQLSSIGDSGCSYMCSHSNIKSLDLSSLVSIGENGCYAMCSQCNDLTQSPQLLLLTTIGYTGCAQMLEGCPNLISASDMPLVRTVDHLGLRGIYADTPLLQLLTQGGELTFEFQLPLTTIGEDPITFSTPTQLADYMKSRMS